MSSDLTKKQQDELKKEVEKQVEQQVQKEKIKLRKRVLQGGSAFGSEFKKHTSTAIMAGFGFIIALSWKDLITKLAENFHKTSELLEKYPYLADLYTAIIVTAISVIGIMFISKWAKTPDKPEKK